MPTWYDDGTGVQTIGYGHTGPLPPGFTAPLTGATGLELLHHDTAGFAAAVTADVHVNLRSSARAAARSRSSPSPTRRSSSRGSPARIAAPRPCRLPRRGHRLGLRRAARERGALLRPRPREEVLRADHDRPGARDLDDAAVQRRARDPAHPAARAVANSAPRAARRIAICVKPAAASSEVSVRAVKKRRWSERGSKWRSNARGAEAEPQAQRAPVVGRRGEQAPLRREHARHLRRAGRARPARARAPRRARPRRRRGRGTAARPRPRPGARARGSAARARRIASRRDVDSRTRRDRRRPARR